MASSFQEIADRPFTSVAACVCLTELSPAEARDSVDTYFSCEIALAEDLSKSLRKEVIQPQVPLRLPCYDLVPVTEPTVDTSVSRRLRVFPAPMT